MHVTITLVIYWSISLCLIAGGFFALAKGFQLVLEGKGMAKEESSIDFLGIKAKVGSIGALVMITAFMWGWAAQKALPKYKDSQVEIHAFKKELKQTNIALALANNANQLQQRQGDKLSKENKNLRKKFKKLVSTKEALEKSIIKLAQDKKKIEKELGETEFLIQSKIDDIWNIKESLSQIIKTPNEIFEESEGVELPPIVVSNGKYVDVNGRVVSVNEKNNFAIVDIGQNEGIKLGDALNVYRGSQHIANLEVIQVRRDIAAADLKEFGSSIKVGDMISLPSLFSSENEILNEPRKKFEK